MGCGFTGNTQPDAKSFAENKKNGSRVAAVGDICVSLGLARRRSETGATLCGRDLWRLRERGVEGLQHRGDRFVGLVAHVGDAEGLSLQLSIAAIDHEL